MTVWKPIETAPKDGTELLLFFPAIVTGAYSQTKLASMMRIGSPRDYPFRQPTHWTDLPTPPGEE